MPIGYPQSSYADNQPADSSGQQRGRALYSRLRPEVMVLSLLIGLLLPLLPASAPSAASMPLRHVIVIDPGHGGDDPGTRGPQGRVEKEVTLQMALELAGKLKNHRGSKKVQIVLTRNKDLDLDLTTRTAIANHHRAALFISLHWTHSTPRHMPDLALFVHHPAEVNPRYPPESSGSLSDNDQAPTFWEAVQTPHFMRSREAAQSIVTAVNGRIAACDCRIYEAPLAALQGADMPTVLIEIDSAGPPPQNTNLSLEPGVDSILGAVAEGVYAFFANR